MLEQQLKVDYLLLPYCLSRIKMQVGIAYRRNPVKTTKRLKSWLLWYMIITMLKAFNKNKHSEN
jgi:hypothetical protein